MDHYTQVNVLPDPEFSSSVLLNALLAKFHKALCDLQASSIGVSFPAYGRTLGDVIRIHGTADALHELARLNWVGGMIGYCSVQQYGSVPKGVMYRTVSRVQPMMSQSKLQRLIKRGSISESEAEQYSRRIPMSRLSLPFFELVSNSNGQKHRRYIQLGEVLKDPVPGSFDQFGLSKTATVPWFD